MEDKRPFGTYPVFCQTGPERCGPDEMFLGYHPLNTPVKCPRCGRWSKAIRHKEETKTVPR
jgi:hypothetical protein